MLQLWGLSPAKLASTVNTQKVMFVHKIPLLQKVSKNKNKTCVRLLNKLILNLNIFLYYKLVQIIYVKMSISLLMIYKLFESLV